MHIKAVARLPPLCKGRGTTERRWRGCWELKSLLSNFARDEFSVTLEFAITIKIDVTEKLSRKYDLTANDQ